MPIVNNLFHILFTGPLLIYVGLKQPEWVWVYRGLLALGIALACYFAYKIFATKWSSRKWWLVIHLAIFFPLLIWVGWKGRDAPKIVFSVLLALGFAAVGYHLTRLLQKSQK